MIKKMSGTIQRARGYGERGFELVVSVSFDAKEFNRIKKKQSPLEHFMPQIKNIVLDACGVRGVPSYAPQSYNQYYPRASKGLVTIDLTFPMSDYNAQSLGVDTKAWSVYKSVDLNTTLESTRHEGHMFAKSVIASKIAN